MLTARQKEFLAAMVMLKADQQGVHYTEIADYLGVSKWTAYDMLNAMAKEGYLSVEREARPDESGAGRCRVLFRLTPKGMAAVQHHPREWEEVWRNAKYKLRTFVEGSHEKGAAEILSEIIQELGNIRNPMIFCAYLIVITLLAYRVVFQGNAQDSVLATHLFSLLAAPQAALVAFIGSLVALILSSDTRGKIPSNWPNYLCRYEAEIRSLDPEAQEVLSSFAAEMASKLWPGLQNSPDKLSVREA